MVHLIWSITPWVRSLSRSVRGHNVHLTLVRCPSFYRLSITTSLPTSLNVLVFGCQFPQCRQVCLRRSGCEYIFPLHTRPVHTAVPTFGRQQSSVPLPSGRRTSRESETVLCSDLWSDRREDDIGVCTGNSRDSKVKDYKILSLLKAWENILTTLLN